MRAASVIERIRVNISEIPKKCVFFLYVKDWIIRDVAQFVERRTDTPLMQVLFPGATRDFSPRVHFQCRLSYGVRTPQCAIACVNIYAHVKDPEVHVRVRLIMETLKYPACTEGWVARLLQLAFPRESNQNIPLKTSKGQ